MGELIEFFKVDILQFVSFDFSRFKLEVTKMLIIIVRYFDIDDDVETILTWTFQDK